MEARIGRGSCHLFADRSSQGLGKKPQEWDLNDWKWDGDLFVATPIHPGPTECGKKKLLADIVPSNGISSYSVQEFGIGREGLGKAEKRRRIVVVEEDEQCYEGGPLSLTLGGYDYPVIEGDNVSGANRNDKSMVHASNSNYPKCQVVDCVTDLSQSKDYHRRHKVCEMHAKASSALVGNVMQRFCQQCSRFHLLQEFDEGKRSCRRRLLGHNKRRRKTNSSAPLSGNLTTDDQTISHLLRIVTKLTSDGSERSKDQEILANILRNIASLCGSSNGNNSSHGLQASRDLLMIGTSSGTPRKGAVAPISGAPHVERNANTLCSPARTISATPMANNCGIAFDVSPSELRCQKGFLGSTFSKTMQHSGRQVHEENRLPALSEKLRLWRHILPAACTADGLRTKEFDLNTVCDEEQHGIARSQLPENPETLHIASYNGDPCMLEDFHKKSPPQASGNTDSPSRSPSSSDGDAQSRTDRIVLKLFGKTPNDFPHVLRAQIINWLSHSPTDMESYIRPGCVILTLYLCLGVSAWHELCCDLGSSLKRLLSLTADDFWGAGWIYARVQHHIAVIYNGQIVLSKSLMRGGNGCCRIVCVTPIAVPLSSRITFVVKCSNLVRSTTRIHCAFEGKYLNQDINQPSQGSTEESKQEQFQTLHFSCFLPDAIGRGFIEVEENDLSSGFFPFIVAEEDICDELRMLESSINVVSRDALLEEKVEAARNLCVSFLHEIGWLLRRCHLRNRTQLESSSLEAFSLVRFRWILRFAIDRDWTAIVEKLLDVLFEENIDSGGLCPTEIALSEDLLHYAVRSNSKSTIKLLLRYKPKKRSDRDIDNCLFRPDMLGPSGITPLHIAATIPCADSILNLLTDDPGQFGLKAWRRAKDSTGLTPEDYARAGGHESYILLMLKKINKSTEKEDVVVNIPAKLPLVSNATYEQARVLKYGKPILTQPEFCKICEQHLECRSSLRRSILYRPMLLAMVGIAAVCVCVGLLLKGPPEVGFISHPFRWELLDYGFI